MSCRVEERANCIAGFPFFLVWFTVCLCPLPAGVAHQSPPPRRAFGLHLIFSEAREGSRESLPCLRRRAWVDWESESGNGVAEVSHTPLRVSISRWLCTTRWLCLEKVTISAGWRRHSTLKPASSQHPAFVERLLPRGGGGGGQQWKSSVVAESTGKTLYECQAVVLVSGHFGRYACHCRLQVQVPSGRSSASSSLL